MKRFSFILFAIVLGLIGCKKNSTTPRSTPTTDLSEKYTGKSFYYNSYHVSDSTGTHAYYTCDTQPCTISIMRHNINQPKSEQSISASVGHHQSAKTYEYTSNYATYDYYHITSSGVYAGGLQDFYANDSLKFGYTLYLNPLGDGTHYWFEGKKQ